MNNRQKLIQQRFLNNEQAIIEELRRVYDEALKEINEKIENLSFSIGKLKQEYDWLDPNDPERAKIKSMIQSKIYQKTYQEQLKKQVGDILIKMQNNQFASVSEYLDECYNDGYIGAFFDAHGQGIPIISPINQESMVRAIQIESKISTGLYTRLGKDVDRLKDLIASEISRGISMGMTFKQVAKYIENQSRVGFNRAVRIARTEGHRIQCASAMDAMENAKSMGANVVKQWDATLDARTRESHAKIDQEIREIDEPFSNGLMYPGDPKGRAAEVVNCRCAILQRARWALGGSFTKYNGFTKQIEEFNSPEDYEDFKKAFFSKENRNYMKYVEQMQDKYQTKDFRKVLGAMSDGEYKHYSDLLSKNPIYNKKP